MQAKAIFLNEATYLALKNGEFRVRLQFMPFDAMQHADMARVLQDADVKIVASSAQQGVNGPLWIDIAIQGEPAPPLPPPVSAPISTNTEPSKPVAVAPVAPVVAATETSVAPSETDLDKDAEEKKAVVATEGVAAEVVKKETIN